MEIYFEEGKIITASTNGHVIRTDQPLDNGGENSAPCPVDLYLAAIGTCAGAYIKSFCDKRNIPTDKIKLHQTTVFDSETDLPTEITLEVTLPDDFPEKYRSSVLCAAELCKVKKSILNPPVFKIV